MVKVLFADNYPAVRDGMRRLLAREPRVQVVGEAADFSEAIAQAHNIRPDVMVLDLHMPFEPGLSMDELSAQLNSCGAKILAISFSNGEDGKSLAMHMGATELLDKMELGNELIPAILRVASGGIFASARMSA